ncbi:glycosyltransferase [Streptomyces sp. GXMU-J5]|uniref:Glycosyltransferase n=1 Tax=Streptomyces beihaiensis TaxID=2984495 RepID=A0ABT3TRM9_9ACTN|nr:glycosyltransferase [Streptomyces beihaiensis]MCX3059430.1 glycosyltransferase [Streptomyces beihaiensis]
MTSGTRTPSVLHVTQPVDGGVARVVADLARGQQAAGIRVVVACPPSGALPGLVREAGCEHIAWHATRSPGPTVPRETHRLAAIVDRVRPDVVHAHSAKAGLAARLAVRGRTPTVFQPHAWSFEAVTGAGARAALKWERFATRWTSRLVCVSRAEHRTGTAHGIEPPWTLVPNGVDLHRFCPGPPAGTAAALTSATRPLVVCVGRLCRQKGQDVLVDAWREVVREVPDARLVLVGDGPDGARLRAAAPASVSFAGPVADPVPWYRAARLLVLPSRWEGMALAPLEAMACGSPVVVTDVAGARESLPPGLAEAGLVPPQDAHALARALVALLRAPERLTALGLEAHQHAHAHHDVRRTVAAMADVYGDVLGQQSTAHREPITT